MAVATRFFTAADGCRLAYQVLNIAGTATPVVLVQGLSGVKEDWRALAPRLAAHRPVLVFDNRGVGESDVPPGPYTMAQLADDTLGLTQHVFGATAAVALVGISMGGMIAQHVVLRAPAGTVRRVILGCTSHGGPNSLPPTDAFLAALTPPSVPAGKLAAARRRQVTADVLRLNVTAAWVAANPAAFEAYVDDNLARRRPQRGILAQLQGILAHDTEADLPRIRVPAFVVHGDEDQVVPVENGRRLAAKLPNARLLILPRTGHLFWDMEPEVTAQALTAFLAEGDVGSARL